MSIQSLKDWTNANQGFVAVILFIATLLVAWLTGLLKWIFRKSEAPKREHGALEIANVPSIESAGVEENRGSTTTEAPSVESMPEPAHVTLSPREICDRIRSLPLLQQEDVARHYKGISMSWSTNVYLCRKWTDTQVSLTLQQNDRLPFIRCEVSLEEYPVLGIVVDGQQVMVSGVIDKVDGYEIHLKNCKLIF